LLGALAWGRRIKCPGRQGEALFAEILLVLPLPRVPSPTLLGFPAEMADVGSGRMGFVVDFGGNSDNDGQLVPSSRTRAAIQLERAAQM
jgi:hypothetical protein